MQWAAVPVEEWASDKFHHLKGKLFLVKWECKKSAVFKMLFNDRKHKYFLQLFNSENSLHNVFELEESRYKACPKS